MKPSKDKQIPQTIKDVGFDFHWNKQKVWGLNVPVEDINTSDLDWHFEIPFWDKPNGGYYDLTPNEVLADPEKYKEEFERTMRADLSHPIDIMFWKNRWLILDGLHRLVKQKEQGITKVKVRKISQESIPLIRREPK